MSGELSAIYYLLQDLTKEHKKIDLALKETAYKESVDFISIEDAAGAMVEISQKMKELVKDSCGCGSNEICC